MNHPERSLPAALVDEELDTLYEHAPLRLPVDDADGTIVKANGTLAAWLGVERDSLIGRRFQELLTIPGRIYHDTHYMALLAMQGAVREVSRSIFRAGLPRRGR